MRIAVDHAADVSVGGDSHTVARTTGSIASAPADVGDDSTAKCAATRIVAVYSPLTANRLTIESFSLPVRLSATTSLAPGCSQSPSGPRRPVRRPPQNPGFSAHDRSRGRQEPRAEPRRQPCQ